MSDFDWSEDAIAKLRALWAEGLSTSEIGRRMWVTKCSVIGKAHRLGLPARPSPIRRDGLVATRASRIPARSRPVALPVLASLAGPAIAHAPLPEPPPPLRAHLAARPGGRVQPCCWPIGEPGSAAFRYCESESVAGRPYCPDHVQVAYVAPRDRREDRARP